MNLVTGATGIVGSHVVLELLQRQQPVVACRQKNSDIGKVQKLFSCYTPRHKELFEKIKWVEVDVRDIFSIEEALAGIDTVYHCAGFVSFHEADKKQLSEINEKGTRNVVDACLAANIKALCHVSSLAVINNLDYTLPLNEDVFWKKSGKESDYAISKYNSEREVWRGMEEGLNAVIVNPGVILSPGFRHQSSAQLFDLGHRGSRFYTNGSTGYVAAADVAKVMAELTEKRQFGNRYILIEGNYTFRHIFSRIQQSFNNPAPSTAVSKPLFNLARLLLAIPAKLTGKRAPLSKAIMYSAFHTQQYSAGKIKSALNFRFTPVDQTIDRICELYNQEING